MERTGTSLSKERNRTTVYVIAFGYLARKSKSAVAQSPLSGQKTSSPCRSVLKPK